MKVTCNICEWTGTINDLVDDPDGEINDETEDVVQLCPRCTCSHITIIIERAKVYKT